MPAIISSLFYFFVSPIKPLSYLLSVVVPLRSKMDPVAHRVYLVGIRTNTADPLLQAVEPSGSNNAWPTSNGIKVVA